MSLLMVKPSLNSHIDHVLEGLVEVVADPVDNGIIENSFNFISFKSNFQIRPSDSIEIEFFLERRTVIIFKTFSSSFQIHFHFQIRPIEIDNFLWI